MADELYSITRAARTRREALTALGATALAGITIAAVAKPESLAQSAAPADDDATMSAAINRYMQAESEHKRLAAMHADIPDDQLAEYERALDLAVDRIHELQRELGDVIPTSPEGVRAKAKVALACFNGWGPPEAVDDWYLAFTVCKNLADGVAV